jgi:HEAT repeat protein
MSVSRYRLIICLMSGVLGCGGAEVGPPRTQEARPSQSRGSSNSSETSSPPNATGGARGRDSEAEADGSPTRGKPDEKPEYSRASAAAAFAKLVAAHREEDPDGWQAAEASLAAHGDTALPALVEALESPDSTTREMATMLLAGLGPNAAEAADGLLKVLGDPSPYIRANAASALSHSPDHSKRVIAVLGELLESDDDNLRTIAVFALGNLGEKAAATVGALIEILESDDPQLRCATAATLGKLGAAGRPALPALEKLSSHEDEATRSAALRAIKLLKPAIPATE